MVLADLYQANADAAAEILANVGFDVTTATVDVSDRESVSSRGTTPDGRSPEHPRGVLPAREVNLAATSELV